MGDSQPPFKKYRRRDHFIPQHRQAPSIATPPGGGEGREPTKSLEDQIVERVESRILNSLASKFPGIKRENSKPNNSDEESEDFYGVSPIRRINTRTRSRDQIASESSKPKSSKRTMQEDSESEFELEIPDLPNQKRIRVSRQSYAKSESSASVQPDANNSHDNSSDAEEKPRLGMPVVIKRLPPLQGNHSPKNPIMFTSDQLRSLLGGTKLPNHLWKVTTPKAGLSRKIKIYGLINPTIQIFAPKRPGQHGAVISNYMFSGDDLSEDFPLFVKDVNGFYTYLGQYREPRFSDVIGYNEMATVIPKETLIWHAKDLCRITTIGKRNVAVEALKEQWPRKVVGWWNEEQRQFELNDDPDKKPDDDSGKCFVCTKKISDDEAEEVDVDDIMAAFETADCDDKPHFRLYWEYLEAVGYDRDFYRSLLHQKQEMGNRRGF